MFLYESLLLLLTIGVKRGAQSDVTMPTDLQPPPLRRPRPDRSHDMLIGINILYESTFSFHDVRIIYFNYLYTFNITLSLHRF